MHKKYTAFVCLFLFALFVSSCTNSTQNKSQRLLQKISSEISNEYNVSESKVIALYNLTEDRKHDGCLFNKNYAKLINDENYHREFISGLRNYKHSMVP